MDYRQARAFYVKSASFGSVLGLESMRRLMEELFEPYRALKIVHIAGTNGKGSVSCFLSSILRKAGIKTGQFNSPAVFEDLETIQVDGVPIGEEAYARHMEQIEKACRIICKNGFAHPTMFEIETALAFLYFAAEQCEIVLLETGLGGAGDATNVIEKPICSVFVSISMDHMQFLGDTLEQIGKIKSGIIKYQCPVVSVAQQEQVNQILRQKARQLEAEFYSVQKPENCSADIKGCRYKYSKIGEVELSMAGIFQIENSACAIETAFLLQKNGFALTSETILSGIKAAYWPGRFEKIHDTPDFYVDGAHNANAAAKLRQTLEYSCGNRKILYIMGVMADKEYDSILKELLPYTEKVYTVTPDNPRALPAAKLAGVIWGMGTPAEAFDDIKAAVFAAYQAAWEKRDNAMVMVFGSLYYLKEVKSVLHEIKGRKQENKSGIIKRNVWD